MNKFTVRREGVVILSGVEGELFEAQRIDLYNRTGARDFAETIQPEDKISWDDQAATIVKWRHCLVKSRRSSAGEYA